MTRWPMRLMSSAAWESTGLVARTVFKTAEAGATRLVGSIPTLSRQIFQKRSIYGAFAIA